MPNSATEPNEITRRVRAAWAYSGKAQDPLSEELEHRTGIKAATWLGYFGKSRSNIPSDYEVLDAVAEATGVPDWFLRHGWDGWERQPASTDQLRLIWLALGELTSRLKRLEAESPASARSGAVDQAERDADLRQLEDLAQRLLDAERRKSQSGQGTAGDSEQ